jgi:hypothetical protein
MIRDRHGIVAASKGVDFAGVAKRQCCESLGVAAQASFAPFVYRLGRHPFTVERAVRFR